MTTDIVLNTDELQAANELQSRFEPNDEGSWGEHPNYPMDDWRDEVNQGHTRLGYWVWVVHQLEANNDLDDEGNERSAEG